MTTAAATASPSSSASFARRLASLASFLFRDVLVPLLLGLGIGAGALAPCGRGECSSSAPQIVSHP